MEALLKFIVQVLIICFVAVVIWYIGNIAIAALQGPELLFMLWKGIIALLALIAVLRAAKPWWP